MKKIMFNDRYGLTQAVLEGRKTQTRRIITHPKTFHGKDVCGFYVYKRATDGVATEVCMYDEDEIPINEGQILPKYKVGEVVPWRKAIVPLQKNWKIAKMQLAPHITRRMCKRLLNTYRGWSIPASIIKCSLPQT